MATNAKSQANPNTASPTARYSPFSLAISRSFALLLLALSGCFARNKPVEEHVLYTGPTQSIQDVIASINQNNDRISTLWASGDFDCWMKDDKGKIQPISGDELHLMFRKPGYLRLTGAKFGIGQIFQVGSNAQQYWLWIPFKDVDTMWWGDYSGNSANSAAIAGVPIRPDLLAAVIGVDSINTNLRSQPLPVMRFNNDRDAYMITFLVSLPDRLVVQKEVWYDRKTLNPTLIAFYDPNGRMILRAYPQQCEHLDNDPKAPVVPTYYDLYFIESETKLVLKFHDIKATYKGVPNDASFRFPGTGAAAKTIKIDDNSPTQ